MAGFDKFLEYSKKWTDKKMLSDLDNFVNNFVETKGQEVIARTKLRTPVDTGALRNSWDKTKVEKYGDKYSVDILNNQDYASFVEYGTIEREWKWKNGAYMLTKSMNEVELGMHDSFDTKFTKFLKDKGIGE